MSDIARTWAASYRARLAVGYLLVVAIFASAWAWSLFGPLSSAIVDQQGDNLQAVAQAGALVLSQTDTTAEETVRRLTARTNLRMTIVASDGTVLADSDESTPTMENHGDRPEIAAALGGQVGQDRRVSETQDAEQVYVAVPASFNGSNVALRVSDSLERINAVARSSREFGMALLAFALALAGLTVARITAIASEPVSRLSASANAMARGNLSTPIPDEAGELRVLSSALSDLREQMRRRLDDLEAEQRNLRTVLDGLPDAVLLLHDDRIRFANSAANSLLKTPSGGWRDRGVGEAGLPESVAGTIRSGLNSGEPVSSECGPDTTGRYLRVSVLPLNPTEQHTRALVILTDVTERIRIDQVRRDFVANASHELKTPTAAVHLLAEAAGNAAEDGDVDQAVAFAGQIAAESERLGRLVQDLLDLSRLESDTTPDSVANVRTAIENAMVGHRVAASARGLELTLDEGDLRDRDVLVACDSTDLAVALDNLLDNAIKYTESGGVTVSVRLEDGDVMVSVTDTGIGIPGQDLPRIFERFYRVDRARSRDSGGTGLGLALVRHMVERADGSIEVSSQPGSGSTFTVTLPRA